MAVIRTQSRGPFFDKKHVVCYSKSRCSMLKILLPVGVNFVARRFPKRRATKFTFITMVFHADGRRISLSLLCAAATGRNDFFLVNAGKDLQSN